jgi:hypothetical protein
LSVEEGSDWMRIRDVEIGPVTINNSETPTRLLTVRIEVSNLSGQSVEYRGWHDAGANCTLRGPLNRIYSMLIFKGSQLPDGCVRTVRLQPREVVRDMIIFEDRGLATIGSLELELPPRPPLASGPLQFTIPRRKIRETSAQPVRMVPPAAPTLNPSSPPAPAEVREAERIRAEADRRWEVVDKAARRKSRARSVDFYKRERVRIRDELFNKHQINRDELKSIAPYLFKL